MKISEDCKDTDMKEKAKVNFGMANASLKWNSHITGLLEQIDKNDNAQDKMDDTQEQFKVDEVSAEEEFDK